MTTSERDFADFFVLDSASTLSNLQARRERALLLRAFESSPLSRANFCALKRIEPAALDALLEQARREAPPAPAPPMRRPDAPRRPSPPVRRHSR